MKCWCFTVRSRYYPRVMIAEVSGSEKQTAQFIKYGEKDGAHIATNVALTNVKKGCSAECVYRLISDWTTVASSDELWSNWQVLRLILSISTCGWWLGVVFITWLWSTWLIDTGPGYYLGWVTAYGHGHWVGKPSEYVTSHLDRLSLVSSLAWQNEYQLLG